VVYASVIVVQRKDKQMNEIVIEGFKCDVCEDTYYSTPSFGYCDNTLACANAYGDSIKPYSWIANEYDLRYLTRQSA
jgi:hypothetical protein